MPRIAEFPACPQDLPPRDNGLVSEDYEFSLLTPMFGGGVEAAVPDPSLPFRATAIRGHLEFWWRASIGARCKSSKELFDAHSKIWGNTEGASKVEIEVLDAKPAELKQCAHYIQEQGKIRLRWQEPLGLDIAYALFPFQGKVERGQITKQPADCVVNGSFTVRVRYPKPMSHDVETALRLWANFGGLGARTRRGCGAIYCQRLAPTTGDPLRIIGDHAPATRDWPTLPRTALTKQREADPVRAWAAAISCLREMRQVPLGRRAMSSQSWYPEPQAIRPHWKI